MKHFLLFLAMIMFTVVSMQAVDVKGTVTDESGEPIIGGTVKVKDSKVGTATNLL